MFIGNMVTEAIPARVYALYRIVDAKGPITRSEIRRLMEPEELCEDSSSYFSKIIKAAIELDLISDSEGMVSVSVAKNEIKTMHEFRRYVISVLPKFEHDQFWKCSNVILNMNEKIYEFDSISDSQMLNYLSEQLKETVKDTEIRGWRFWSQFLGFGYMNEFVFLPNAYVFVKDTISLMELEKKKEYDFDEFMNKFINYGKIVLPAQVTDYRLNIALSNALRQLHDNGEIELRSRSDQEGKWVLYPSKESFNQHITSVVYKGVKRFE